MSKTIAQAFGEKAFIAYLMAGDPHMEATKRYIRALAEGGADCIEIGIPFSDPVAEGPVIQEASERALKHRVTTDAVFDMVKEVAPTVESALLLMTYANPIFVYGIDAFFKRCADVGVQGVIVPDVPFEEKEEFAVAARAHGIAFVSLIAPTSADRIARIAKEAEGFIYLVSSLGVTGVRSEITTDIGSLVAAIRAEAKCPVAVGFGIATPEQAKAMAALSDGAIVGSAIVKQIAEAGDDVDGGAAKLKDYAAAMKAACVGK